MDVVLLQRPGLVYVFRTLLSLERGWIIYQAPFDLRGRARRRALPFGSTRAKARAANRRPVSLGPTWLQWIVL